ncbi:bifunctional protein-serine/threonine kinase/phosphatase [Phaeobacter sp. B1627]|uniref:bifunctional protein-serine/threonine kinase/phosphatase n=1 Tax=Phaeobacter sp. B1627 TaxID=2583809 RepID=UPI00111A8682|nr:bifunctional protein-serine/threonine kinase/phosphatase [Phaeobacter sp. B1627]TNJ48408.1 bifunctional protein-serine/threonine kinase/phosphatase [Phaeobacter sp. B1627]
MSKDLNPPPTLAISLGQWSSAGRKPDNKDFHGAIVPTGETLALKGITVAIADGISSSSKGRDAAEIAVKGLLTDYYSTSDAATVKPAASCVIAATNGWLHSKNRAAHIEDIDHGWVTTLSALILKGGNAHIFHVGDSRIWRLSGRSLEQLTQDHTVSTGSGGHILSRAMGAGARVEIDYVRAPLAVGDVFVLTTDGVHETISGPDVAEALHSAADLDAAAEALVRAAFEAGSPDNLTVQILRIDALAPPDTATLMGEIEDLPCPDFPKAGDIIDGYTIQRAIHANARSHIYLALAPDGSRVAFKIPSLDLRADPAYRRRFLMEEWIARRLDNTHVLRAVPPPSERTKFYILSEFVEGQTLRQWMRDRPRASLQEVRDIIAQLIAGVRAMHRREMLHQDIRPENVMIDPSGTVRIIDFGSTFVAGVAETARTPPEQDILGTLQYAAPEYFAGDRAGPASDLYSIGVIAYEMLTGRLPYGPHVARVRAHRDLHALRYSPARDDTNGIPDWVDDALRRAVHPIAANRYPAMSEFLADLKRPSAQWSRKTAGPLMERNPVAFWKALSAGLFVILMIVLAL